METLGIIGFIFGLVALGGGRFYLYALAAEGQPALRELWN
jgi:hypothetical protein